MFCPGCGLEDPQRSHFCRSCGADLRGARAGLEKTDAVTSTAITAREEIARAFALRIQQVGNAKDLAIVADSVLPEVEKFLEGPEEKRLRRIRRGVVTASMGLAVLIFFTFAGILADSDLFPFAGPGLLIFLIGLGIVINGVYFSTTGGAYKEPLPGPQLKSLLERATAQARPRRPAPGSVTEHTTHHLLDEHAHMPPRATNEKPEI